MKKDLGDISQPKKALYFFFCILLSLFYFQALFSLQENFFVAEVKFFF